MLIEFVSFFNNGSINKMKQIFFLIFNTKIEYYKESMSKKSYFSTIVNIVGSTIQRAYPILRKTHKSSVKREEF
jgi:hypothetical protein